MTEESNSSTNGQNLDRSMLIRDIVVLQLKLLVDGLRDFILVPISLIFGISSLIKGGDARSSRFYELLRKGRQSDHWINLFGAAERVYGSSFDEEKFAAEDIDDIVNRVESFVVEEYRRGGVTRQAKDRLDQAIDSLHKIAPKGKDTETPAD